MLNSLPAKGVFEAAKPISNYRASYAEPLRPKAVIKLIAWMRSSFYVGEDFSDVDLADLRPPSEGSVEQWQFHGRKVGVAFKRGVLGQVYYDDNGFKVIEPAPAIRPLLHVRLYS